MTITDDPGSTTDHAGQLHLLPRRHAVLRMTEVQAAELPDSEPIEGENDQTMLMNMGPSHPSTHGVLRLMLELDGETVIRSKPVIGYLHTGMEKTGETLTYLQGPTNVTRMDYASPLFNELVFSLATEALIGIEVPPDLVPPAVHGHQRYGPRGGLDDDLRVARTGTGPAVLPEGHRPADEPQLHPPRRGGRRPAGRLA
jgi:hypothetical protein